MRTRPLTQLLVLTVSLAGFAPAALAAGPRNLRAGVPGPPAAEWTGGASLGPQAGVPTVPHNDVPALPRAGTHGVPPVDIPAAPGGTAPSPGASVSGATAQTIVQIQVGACSSHCDGTTETQSAQQQAVTMQSVTGGRGPRQPDYPGQALRLRAALPHATHVTRGQIGCLAHCFGTTTRGLRLDGNRRKLRRLLRALTGSQSLMPIPAGGTSQSTVAQVSYQRQHGLPALKSQRQRSSQTSITIQSARLAPKLIHNLQSALAAAAPVEAVNQTVQRIWQLQIGCLSHCAHTFQYQQAKQTSTVVQSVARVATSAAVQDSTSQSIWQLQIGCLVWCFSAVEQQRANSRHLTLNTVTAPSPPGRQPSGPIRFEATVASQSGGAGVTIVAGSGQAIGVPAPRPSGERSRLRQVGAAHPPRRRPPRASMPQAPVATSSAVSARPDEPPVALAVVAGLIVLLATVAASRVTLRRGRR